VLIVHLQRIVFSFDTFNNEKINTKFEFPNILDLNKNSFKETMKKEGKTKEDFSDNKELQDLFDIEDDSYIYRLVGVNIHTGTADHGHYYSLINTKRGSDEPDPVEKEDAWLGTHKDTWRKYDDESVSFFSFKDVATDAFGGDQTSVTKTEVENFLNDQNAAWGKSAYMLFYECKKKKPIRQVKVVKTETEDENVTKQDSAET